MREFVNLTIDEKFIEEAIIQEVYIQSGHKTTICVLILNTGHEVVGSFTATKSPPDVLEGKEKSRDAAWSKVEDYFIQLNSWRLAIYNSEKALYEKQQAKEAELLKESEKKPTNPTPRKAKPLKKA